MPDAMTARERIDRILALQEADRIAIPDIPWPSTLAANRRMELCHWAYFEHRRVCV